MLLMAPDIQQAIEAIAQQQQLPANLVRAVCLAESSGNRWALKYEAGYRWIVGDKLTMTSTERFGQMCSWGLMQVMGGVAREQGFTGYFPQLCEPSLGILYGCRHLKKFYEKYQNWPDAIASYNAGSPRRIGESYINQAYVLKVQATWAALDKPEREL